MEAILEPLTEQDLDEVFGAPTALVCTDCYETPDPDCWCWWP